MKLFIRTLLFVFLALVSNVKVTSAAITFPNIQETTSFPFHNETQRTLTSDAVINAVAENRMGDDLPPGNFLTGLNEHTLAEITITRFADGSFSSSPFELVNMWNEVDRYRNFLENIPENHMMGGYGPDVGLRGLGSLFRGVMSWIKAAKGGVQYTKSSLQLGQQMHKAYKVGDVVEGVAMKEFRGIPGIRPDFVDFSTKTIYELKPFNPRAMQQGWNQLNKYQNLFQQKYGGTWKTVLDTY